LVYNITNLVSHIGIYSVQAYTRFEKLFVKYNDNDDYSLFTVQYQDNK